MRRPSGAAGSTVIREPQASACAAPRELKLAAQAMESRAFTLVEMLVSLAVLSVALSVVGVVFTVTTRTVSQTAAISEVHAVLRQFMLQLEEDLSGVDPSHSVLFLRGGTQRAALNADDRAAEFSWRVLVGNPNDVADGYDPRLNPNVDPEYSNPRTDVLAFFSARPTVSKAPPLNPARDEYKPYLLGAKSSTVHVTYGFAALAEAEQDNGGNWQFDENSIRHIYADAGSNEFGELTISNWQLTRRAIIISEPISRSSERTNSRFDSFERFTTQQFKRFWRSYTSDNTEAADIVTLNFERHLSLLGGVPLLPPYIFSQNGDAFSFAESMVFGPGAADRHVATVIPRPPAALKSNLGVHMLPGCAWFEVEFLMPEDPRNSIDYFDPYFDVVNDRNRRDDMPQWTEVEAGQSYVFIPDTPQARADIASSGPGGRIDDFASMDRNNPDDIRQKRIRTWPYAIRVTVRVFDPLGRLEEPIVRSLIHRFD